MANDQQYDPLQLLSPKETAERLGVSAITLGIWRSTGRQQLPYVKVGRKVMYRRADIQQYIETRHQGGNHDGT